MAEGHDTMEIHANDDDFEVEFMDWETEKTNTKQMDVELEDGELSEPTTQEPPQKHVTFKLDKDLISKPVKPLKWDTTKIHQLPGGFVLTPETNHEGTDEVDFNMSKVIREKKPAAILEDWKPTVTGTFRNGDKNRLNELVRMLDACSITPKTSLEGRLPAFIDPAKKPDGTLPVLIECMAPWIQVPRRATKGSAGYDVFSPVSLRIPPRQRRKINLRFRLLIPDGWEFTLRQRSSLAIEQNIHLDGQPCTIDSDYLGWLFIVLANRGRKPYILSQGDRIAQLIPQRVPEVNWYKCEKITCCTERGTGGFGSTGR